MSHSPSSHPVNSKAWWEEYFNLHWDANQGSKQTDHFMERLLTGLEQRTREYAYFSGRSLDVLDWGCAFGEGAARLAGAFPRSRVSGLDFSEEAVAVAQRRYPALEFLRTEDGRVPRDFDVIVTSNCLEHFDDPLAVARDHMRSCRKLYVILVPYREDVLSEFHKVRFDDDTFPGKLGGFTRLWADTVDVDPPFWYGKQLLVVYGSDEYLAEVGAAQAADPDDISARERAKWDAYYGSIADVDDDDGAVAFGAELSARVAEFLPTGAKVLEAGCGAGQQSMALAADRRYDLTLMDFSEEALGHARRWFGRRGVGAEFVRGDVLKPGEPEFDLVFNAGVLEHYTFDEQVKFLEGMASRSRQYVLALVPNRLCYWYWLWRLNASADGYWPYGKEAPSADLSQVFEAAGLTFLGQFFGGSVWSENFVNLLPGLDPKLRDLVLKVHRSALIPDWQKAYLVGALGSKGARPALSTGWSPSYPKSTPSADVANASLADTLAMVVAGEQRLTQAKTDAYHEITRGRAERDQMAAYHAQREAEFFAQRAEFDARAAELTANIAVLGEHERDLAALLDDRDRTIVELRDWLNDVNAGLDFERTTRESFQAALAAKQSEVDELRHWSLRQAEQIASITNGRTWRVMQWAWRARRKVAPPGSLPARAGKLGLRAARKAKQGPVPFARAVARAGFRHLPGPVRSRVAALVFRQRSRAVAATGAADSQPRGGIPGLVSVVLPVYNQADLLASSIESVLTQTYPDFELIVVNDGSSDGVEAVLAEYIGHPKVRLLTQPNQRLPKALSNGFDFARGEFWTWTSADNLMLPDQLSRQVEFLRANPDAGMVYADYYAIDDRGEPLRNPHWRPQNRRTPDSHEIHLPRSAAPLNTVEDNFIGPCFMYRGWIGRVIGDYDPTMGVEDYDYWMRINDLFSIRHLGTDELLYSYRVHDNSLSKILAGQPIVDLCNNLIEYEKGRSAYYARPWTLAVDREVAGALRGVQTAPHGVVVCDDPVAIPEGEKVLALMSPASLAALAGTERPEGLTVAAWFGDGAEVPYESRSALRSLGAVGFTSDPATAERLAVLNTENHLGTDDADVFGLAVRWANNRSYYHMTHPTPARHRVSPVVFQPVGRRLRVAIQVDNFTQGGLEQVILSLATSLDPKRFKLVMLVLGEQGQWVDRARAAGLRVVSLPAADREAHYREFLINEGIDLVNAHYSVFGARAAAELGVPFVQVVHNTYVWLDPEQVNAYRDADPYTSCYVCVSDEVARYSDVRLGLSASKMVVVPNAVPPAEFAASCLARGGPLRRELGFTRDHFVFLNVASVHATKAQVPAVQALAQVLTTHPNAKLVLLGRAFDRAYLSELEKQIGTHGLERSVVLAGHCEDPSPYYGAADAFLIPSYWEGWSLALNEALSAGLPVVATDVGAARDLVTPDLGRLVRPPFGSITELDWLNLGQLLRGHDSRFVAGLADAMRWACDHPSRVELPAAVREQLDQTKVFGTYADLFAWLVQGGRPAAARTWTRPAQATLAPPAHRRSSDNAHAA